MAINKEYLVTNNSKMFYTDFDGIKVVAIDNKGDIISSLDDTKPFSTNIVLIVNNLGEENNESKLSYWDYLVKDKWTFVILIMALLIGGVAYRENIIGMTIFMASIVLINFIKDYINYKKMDKYGLDSKTPK